MAFLIKIIINIFLILPLKLRISIGSFVGFLFSLLPTQDRLIAHLQIKKILKSKNSKKILQMMYQSFGKTLVESFYIKQILNSEESFTIVNVDAIKTIQSEGRGGLILAAHIGNWEILGAWIAKNFNRPFTVFGRLIDNPGLQKALGDIRSGYGVKVLSKNDKAAGISVIRSLRKKEFVGAVIDQDTNVKSEMINFFGIKANTPSALVKTAQKGNYPIYAFFLIRTAPLTYSIFTHIIDSNKSTEDVLNEYNNILESLIKKYPEQWVWVHKRWRTLESLERLNSKQYINYLNRMIG